MADGTAIARFCWMDLATTDADQAKRFYAGLFGWTAHDQAANGGHFTRLRSAGRDVGSLYQLGREHLSLGAASHWTPYVRVEELDEAAARSEALGGVVAVRPFAVEGVARIALILDPLGAQIGLWEPPPS